MGEEGIALSSPFSFEENSVFGVSGFANKRAIVFNMAQQNSSFQKLLEGLSVKELDVLRRYPDLIDRVRDIAKLTEVQAIASLKEDFNLEVDGHLNGDVWIATEKLEEAIPEWFHSDHCGWFKTVKDGELLDFAKNIMMQEVRINICLKYLEHKKDPKPEIFYGQYL
jgi:hypothetical protein